MTSFFSRPLALLFGSLVSISVVFSICADGDWDWFESNSSFAPEAYVQDQSYTQLFYSTNMFYGENGYDQEHSHRFENSLVTDWNGFLKGSLSPKELKYFIVSDSSSKDVKEITKAFLAKKGQSNWGKKINLQDPKQRQFFIYINLAKSLEVYMNNSASWNYTTDSMDPMQYMSVKQAQDVEKIYLAAKDSFLKSKYWILTLKSYFYSQNRNEAITFFNKTQAAITKDETYYRGLSYVAGAIYKNKNYASSNFLYSVVFDNCPKLRTVATYCFHPQNDADFMQAMAMAKTNSQKAALWALYGYYADEVQAIGKIYELEPSSKHLDYMLTRALNIAENKMNEAGWNYQYGKETKLKNEVLDARFYDMVLKIAKSKNTTSPYLWNIAAGYLEVIKGNHSSAANFFVNAEKGIPDTKLAKEQLKLFQIFNEIASTKKMDTAAEQRLLPSLKWLYAFEKEGNVSNLRTNFMINWSKNYIALLYKNQGNEVFSELFFRTKDFYLNPQRLEKMQRYLSSNASSAWDIFAQSLYDVTLEDIYEFKAIKYAYANTIENAISELNKTTKLKEVVLLGNPFNGNIKDCHDCDHAAFQKTKYTKIGFLQKILELQQQVKAGNDTYMANLLLGNAFYNMSFYGNARLFYDNKIINQYYTNEVDEVYQSLLVNDDLAGKYYQAALAVAKTDEQKAKMIYLLTKIERNAFYHSTAFKPYEVDYIPFEGFKKLKKDYSKTKFYQEVIKECGYFKTYSEK